MQRKKNENDFGKMMRKHGYYAHKWGDVRYCPYCHTPLPKAEKKPDFLIATQYAFVEAKGAGNSWHFDGDFRPNQREFMDANIHRSWVFVEIGEGRAPTGKTAFLMPWAGWKTIEDMLLSMGFKSVVFLKADRTKVPAIQEYVPSNFFLTWKSGTWTIPLDHPWNSYYIHYDIEET